MTESTLMGDFIVWFKDNFGWVIAIVSVIWAGAIRAKWLVFYNYATNAYVNSRIDALESHIENQIEKCFLQLTEKLERLDARNDTAHETLMKTVIDVASRNTRR